MSLVGLAWHPLRLILPSLAIALVASGMGSGKGRLQLAAVLICGLCLFFGLTIAVALSKPLGERRPAATTEVDMGRPDVDGLNTGYAALLLEQYLDNPGAVPEEWRELFESEPEALLQRQPGLARLLELAAADGDGHAAPPTAEPAA